MEETIVKKETSSTEKNVLAYLQTHDLKYVTEDAIFRNLGTGEVHKGRAEIGAMLHFMYHVAFDARLEVTNCVITENKATAEGFFKGRHIGEIAGIKATNNEIDVPIAVNYELKNGLIKEARIYMLGNVLMEQLGVTSTTKQKTTFVVRDIFQLKFGHFGDVKVLLDEANQNKLFPEAKAQRILTDFTGDAYRIILEEGYDSLSEYETSLTGGMATQEFKDWYSRFKPHIEKSHREILKHII